MSADQNKAKVEFARKFEHGQIGAEVEVDKDRKPTAKVVGKFEW